MSDTAPADAPAQEPTATEPDQPETDWKAEHEKLQREARKWEERAKANAAAQKELEQLRTASMTEQEKAVEQARQEARSEVLREVAADRVSDAVRLAAAGRPVDVDALLEGLDRSRFVTDDGVPDADAISAWVDRVAPKPSTDAPTFADLGQGPRVGSSVPLGSDALAKVLERSLGINS